MIIAGIGLRAGIGAAEILACLDRALAEVECAEGQACTPRHLPALRLATVAGRAGEPGLVAAARQRNAELISVSETVLKAHAGACVTSSPRIIARYGVGSVAEAAALAVAGPGAELILPRITATGVTCALARSFSS